MLDNQEDIVPYENKSFDELVKEFNHRLLNAGQLVPLIFQKGREVGMQDSEIRSRILRAGMPYRTMLRYVPPDSKREYKRYQVEKSVNGRMPNARLVIQDEEPKLPPAPVPQVIEHRPEAEPKPEPEMPMPMNKHIHEHAFMPLPFADQLNKFLLARIIGIARANGHERIRFKINNEGDLYLP